MAKKLQEDLFNSNEEDFEFDNSEKVDVVEVEKKIIEPKEVISSTRATNDSQQLINCLRSDKIIVRHISKQLGMKIDNPRHPAYGGMLETATKRFCVPMNEKGVLVNVLTNSEKAYLEYVMGLQVGDLSVYKKVDNYWASRFVSLTKQDTILDLSVPEQYIDYKILCANRDYIAKSLQELEDTPKATYQFVIISSNEEDKRNSTNISITMQCYKEFGKIEDDIYTMRTIVEILDGKPTNKDVKIEFLKNKVNELIQMNGKLFLKVIKDEYLPIKVLIKKCIEKGLIITRNNLYYVMEGNTATPMCENGMESTINNASKYLAAPQRQQLKLTLESKVK